MPPAGMNAAGVAAVGSRRRRLRAGVELGRDDQRLQAEQQLRALEPGHAGRVAEGRRGVRGQRGAARGRRCRGPVPPPRRDPGRRRAPASRPAPGPSLRRRRASTRPSVLRSLSSAAPPRPALVPHGAATPRCRPPSRRSQVAGPKSGRSRETSRKYGDRWGARLLAGVGRRGYNWRHAAGAQVEPAHPRARQARPQGRRAGDVGGLLLRLGRAEEPVPQRGPAPAGAARHPHPQRRAHRRELEGAQGRLHEAGADAVDARRHPAGAGVVGALGGAVAGAADGLRRDPRPGEARARPDAGAAVPRVRRGGVRRRLARPGASRRTEERHRGGGQGAVPGRRRDGRAGPLQRQGAAADLHAHRPRRHAAEDRQPRSLPGARGAAARGARLRQRGEEHRPVPEDVPRRRRGGDPARSIPSTPRAASSP